MAGKVLSFLNGFPGQVSRAVDAIIEAFANAEETAHIAFGAPVALVDGNVMNVSADNTNIIGVAVRGVKTNNTYGQEDADFLPGEMVDVLKRGTIVVPLTVGEGATPPAAGDQVYVVKATGAYAFAADGDNTIAVSGWKFKGAPDANGVVEIVLTERAY